jgi:hypothetical protein
VVFAPSSSATRSTWSRCGCRPLRRAYTRALWMLCGRQSRKKGSQEDCMPVSRRLWSESRLCVSPLQARHGAGGTIEDETLIYDSRRFLLGIRRRQAARLERFNRQRQPVQRRTDFSRRLLQRHSHDHHHRTLRARQGAPPDPGTKNTCPGREAKVLGRR